MCVFPDSVCGSVVMKVVTVVYAYILIDLVPFTWVLSPGLFHLDCLTWVVLEQRPLNEFVLFCVTQGLSSAAMAAERTLAKVGRGVTLSLEWPSNTAWLYNRSEFPVFALSPTTHVVLKLRPGQSACVYEWPRRGQRLNDDEDRKTDFERTSRQPDCVLVSFVKGWSGRYKRQSILSCPCWLQVLMARTPDGSWNDDDATLS